jgi:hypothetical protein
LKTCLIYDELKELHKENKRLNDAQWIEQLHACGLLKASFRPVQSIAALRCYLRTRERMLDYAAAHIQHMQKALTHMNIQLHHVIADMTGVTGMNAILKLKRRWPCCH